MPGLTPPAGTEGCREDFEQLEPKQVPMKTKRGSRCPNSGECGRLSPSAGPTANIRRAEAAALDQKAVD